MTHDLTVTNFCFNGYECNLKNTTSINKAAEYSEIPDQLKSVIKSTAITAQYIEHGVMFNDKQPRMILKILIVRDSKRITRKFGMSIADEKTLKRGSYQEKLAVLNGLLYSILCCCRSEFYCPDTFEDFCNEFGYDTDSIKALKAFKGLQKQSAKLHKVFTENEIESFPS